MEIRRNDNRDELLKQRLDRFNLSTRTENCLHSANVRTVAALVSLRSTDVLRWPRAGKKTLTELKLLLGRVGLKFSDDRAPLHVIEELSSKESLTLSPSSVFLKRG